MAFKRVFIFLAVLILIPIVTYIAIRFARGERINPETKTLTPTGLLVASSIPDGAPVYLDGKLKTATDDTVNLTPGDYDVEIKKDGFHPWKKKLSIEKELVIKTDAYLFSTFPSLKSLTYTGAANPVISPDSQKIAFSVATASASKPGLWMLELADRPLGLSREPRQILESAPRGRDFSQSSYRWSPDSKQLMITLKNRPGKTQGTTATENFIIESDRLNETTDLIDVTPNLDTILDQWDKERILRKNEQISKLPKKLLEVIKETTVDIEFAPNEKKILYTATASATIPEKLLASLPASNSQPENRRIEPGKIYIYDLIEDKNFYLIDEKDILNTKLQIPNSASKALSWFPTSQHLFFVRENKVTIFEYDNTNWTDVYTGPFVNGFAFPFPSGDRILILASLGENQPPNLYAVSLR
ncbi:MAG TPA: PEGA domain-containing protein [Candidatus Bathyarchaeia archaeon]|nr:PEGA domain-containing protein [Candidatus Bathyarchaeia archaeon]